MVDSKTEGHSPSGKVDHGSDATSHASTDVETLPLETIALHVLDAPPSHVAHDKVRYNAEHKVPYASFVTETDGSKISFTTTLVAAGSRKAAEVISRACYLKFEAGHSKDEVTKFKNECCAKLREERGKAASTLLGKAATPTRNTTLIEDAPSGSAAHEKVKFNQQRQACNFEFHRDGEKITFQTTLKAAGNDKDLALRVARICYAKFEEGASKEQVKSLREELYKRFSGQAPMTETPPKVGQKRPKAMPAGPSKKSKTTKKEDEIIEGLRKNGRIDGAIKIQGRATKKKNESMNGIFIDSRWV